jgi:histidinol-phosphate aminotransferase
VLLGSGSTQILRTSTHVFTSKTAGLVAAIPAYEECADYARLMGHPITGVKLDANLRMDLDAMQQASKGAGLVFYCNPNNPVATAVTGSDTRTYLAALTKASPATTVLVDEAYFEYGTMPGYETMIPLAVQNPRVVVARTFSKCFGMAGIRIGYAIGHKDTIAKMAAWDGVGNITVMALQGAKAALAVPDSWVKDEQKRNEAARSFTQKWFAERGYAPTDSQTNFIFVNVKRPAREFREGCLKQGVLVGRDFPPYEKTHVRISVGTMEEMQKAVQVFDQVLAQPAKAA